MSELWSVLDPNTEEFMQRILLLYGPSGSGKTRLAAQFPDPLFLSCDPGNLGGALSAAEFRVKHIKISSYRQLMDLLPKLKPLAGKDFKTIVLDSATYLAQQCMNGILKQIGREIPRFEEWNLNASRLRQAIIQLTDMQCHVIITAVERYQRDEVTGKISGGPHLPGQLSTEISQACDVVARLFTSTGYGSDGKLQVRYRFRTVPDDTFYAKDRTNLLPREGESSFDIFKPLFKGKE